MRNNHLIMFANGKVWHHIRDKNGRFITTECGIETIESIMQGPGDPTIDETGAGDGEHRTCRVCLKRRKQATDGV